MNSIPPIVKASKFVHVANTRRSHLNPHHPSSMPFLNVMNALVATEGGHHTSQWLFLAIASIVITGSPKSLSKQIPWSANTLPLTSKRYKSLLHGVEKGFVWAGDWVMASFSMDVFGGTKKAVAHSWCHRFEMIHISAARLR
jgi:hypothetical protein